MSIHNKYHDIHYEYLVLTDLKILQFSNELVPVCLCVCVCVCIVGGSNKNLSIKRR